MQAEHGSGRYKVHYFITYVQIIHMCKLDQWYSSSELSSQSAVLGGTEGWQDGDEVDRFGGMNVLLS